MAIWVSSDWHCGPGRLREAAAEWVRRGREGNHRLIGAGDLFDIIPWGRQEWRQAASIGQLAGVLDGYPLDYVAGNHDPYSIVKELMSPYPCIAVHRQLEIEVGGRKYLVAHGHKWAVDWGFLGLRHIAPQAVDLMVDVAPGWWYRFCRWRGWLASHPDAEASSGEERERITRLTRVIWGGACDWALRSGCCVVLGHTHASARHEQGVSRQLGFQAYMVDGGDLPDGTYVEITDDARLRFLL